mgnify:CR=1 FL=1
MKKIKLLILGIILTLSTSTFADVAEVYTWKAFPGKTTDMMQSMARAAAIHESQGAKVFNKKVGNFGIGGSFSFYWGHHMSTIEGGMICTNDKETYHNLLMLRSHGMVREVKSKKFPSKKYSY